MQNNIYISLKSQRTKSKRKRNIREKNQRIANKKIIRLDVVRKLSYKFLPVTLTLVFNNKQHKKETIPTLTQLYCQF